MLGLRVPQVSTDGGTTFTNVHTSASDNPANANGQNFGEGISGVSGHALACDDNLDRADVGRRDGGPVSAYAGQTVQLRFRYWTDGAAVGDGFGRSTTWRSRASRRRWRRDRHRLDVRRLRPDDRHGHVARTSTHYYLAEYRKYRGYDLALELGPYNFVDPPDEGLPNLVEHFPYQDGLLIWYWDTSQRGQQRR